MAYLDHEETETEEALTLKQGDPAWKERHGAETLDGSPLVRRTVSSPTSSMCTTPSRSRVKC